MTLKKTGILDAVDKLLQAGGRFRIVCVFETGRAAFGGNKGLELLCLLAHTAYKCNFFFNQHIQVLGFKFKAAQVRDIQ